MSIPRVSFAANGPFHCDLKRRVDDYFAQTGKSRSGGGAIVVKTAVLLAWLAGSYALLMLARPSAWQAALLAVSLGLAAAGVGFCVMHDANHGAYSSRPWLNRLAGFSLDLLGGSSYFWNQKHNVLHHTYPNISRLDDDIDVGSPAVRLAPWHPHRWFHRYQHLYVWVLYALFPIGWWLVDDTLRLIRGRVGESRVPRPRGWALVGVLGGKALFVSWAFVVPALLHPTWALVPLWLLGASSLGLALGTVFQLAHCVGEADFLEAQPGQALGVDWAVHQVATTVDFARGNRALSWYVGGLNYQIEHHLFPRVSHLHYPSLSRIVEETCKAHGLRYRSEPTLGRSLAANLRWLRTMGAHG